MRQMQVCSHGHRWDPILDNRPDPQSRYSVCPVCGGSVEMFSLHDTSVSGHGLDIRPPTPPTGNPLIPGYQILSILGYGGVGVVYKARQVATDRVVAVKMLSAGLRARPSELARFQKEARAAARLSHEHIVDVIEIGEHEGLPYVVMEYMDKGTLADAIAGNPMQPRRAAEIVEMVARAAQVAHDAGIIHRDLKPGNVLLGTAPAALDVSHPAYSTLQLLGVPRVADFGLAKHVDEEGAQTRTGAVMGTPAYMAPEQAEGKSRTLTHAVDVYALGAILYECLTGRPPFQAPTVLETIDRVRTEEPDPPGAVQSGIPRDLETICMKCLEKVPTRRYARAGDLAADLRAYLNGATIQAKPRSLRRRVVTWLKPYAVPAAFVAMFGTVLAMATVLMQGPTVKGGSDEAERVVYFSNLVKRRGVPEGIGPLTEAQVKRRELSFRFRLRGTHVEKVEAIDRAGRPNARHGISTRLAPEDSLPFTPRAAAPPDAPVVRTESLATTTAFVGSVFGRSVCTWDYMRDREGNLVKEVARDAVGRAVWTFQLTNNHDTGQYADERGFLLTRPGSGAAYVKLQFDDHGFEKEVRFLGRGGKPRPDGSGIIGRRYERDGMGLPTAVTYFNSREKPALNTLGVARIIRNHDTRGNLLEEAYLDLRGKPARGRFGPGTGFRYTYNSDGNIVTQQTLGVPPGVSGVGQIQVVYDQKGHRQSEETLPANPGGPPAYRRVVYDYDQDDNCIRVRSQAADGKPILDPSHGSYGQEMTYDAEGRVRTLTHLGPDGKPAEEDAAVAGARRRRGKVVRIKYEYNERGQLVAEAYLGLDGTPAADPNGVARYTCEYDEPGRPTKLCRFAADGKPVGEAAGFACRTWKYDEEGRLVETTCLDGDGRLLPATSERDGPQQPTLVNLFQFSRATRTATFPGGRVTFAYDDRGNLEKVALFGRNNEPSEDHSGFTRAQGKYDESGNLTELATFEADGDPKANAEGVARVTWAFDPLGNLTELATFGPDGKLVAVSGIARVTRRFDDQYNLLEESYFGPDGKPAGGRLGYSKMRYRYDGDGNLLTSEYLDDDGDAVPTRVVWQASGRAGLPGADQALEAGDVFQSYDGEEVRCARMFLQRKRQEELGGPAKELRVVRKGKPRTLKIPAGALRIEDFARPGGRPPRPTGARWEGQFLETIAEAKLDESD